VEFQKKNNTTPWKVIRNSKGEGALKARIFRGKVISMKLNWNFLGEGGDAKQKTFRGGSMDIFWNYTLQDYEKTPFVCSIEEGLKILHFEANK